MEFRILGPLEVFDGDRPIRVTRPKQRAILALLLLNANEVVSSDRILDLVWGEEPPETAATGLRVQVSRLRKLLGPDVIETRAPGYVLRIAPEQLDLARFERRVAEARELPLDERAERLSEALSLWRGEPLADLSYEAFLQAEIARLAELRLAALEERIGSELDLGRGAELVGELERLVAAHPLRERLRGQLMLALYREGRQAEALEVYRQGRLVLSEELGLEPSPALKRLERQILSHDRVLESTPAAERAGSSPVSASLEARKPDSVELLRLQGERASLGTSASNDLVISGDRTVSHVHAVLERVASSWSVHDLGSRNGTFVNGERIIGERILRHGDEIRVGGTLLVYRVEEPSAAPATATQAAERLPELTRRDRDVLLALCRPVFLGSYLTEPASAKAIAVDLGVTEGAVEQHLTRLYDRFGLREESERRPGRLANEAIRRGAVTPADLHPSGARTPL